MSDYEYTDEDGDKLTLESGKRYVTVTARGLLDTKAIFVANADAPTVAAELLKAAGFPAHADLLADAVRDAAEMKLQERRTAVLAALLPEAAAANNLPHPHELSTLDDRAIDRIIELEDGK